MTCVIGYLDKKNSCIWMGCDSLTSNGITKNVEGSAKAFHNDAMKNIIIGGTTSFRHLNLLRYTDNLFDQTHSEHGTAIDHRYMVAHFIPKVIKIFHAGVAETSEANRGANFIVGVDNKLFEVQNDYAVLEPQNGICAVGCGKVAALGSLYTTMNDDRPIPYKIEAALSAAESIVIGVQRPFRIINTRDDREIIIT